MLKKLSSAAVVIDALRVDKYTDEYRGPNMIAYVLLNFFNGLIKFEACRAFFFRNKFNKLNNT